jgi:DNA-binding winged helix-turn-helix (wHTH) protein/tetratricopeptide (TPR) repeat protein
MSNSGKNLLEFGDFRLDPGRRLLLRENQPIQLQPKAFDTLLALVQNSDRVVTKDELMKLVWPDAFVEESNLTQNIFVLRKTLGETAGDNRFIVTVPGRGYRFAEMVRAVAEEDDVVVESHSLSRVTIEEATVPEVSRSAIPPPHPWLAHRKHVAIVAVILAAGGVVWYAIRNTRPPITEQDSIVLADFENRTGDPAFDGTLQKVLEIEISQSPYLNILPDQDVRQTLELMRRRPDEPVTRQVGLEICQRREVKAMMSGSIASLGNRYVLTLEAANCATGGVLAGATAEAESKERVLRALDETTAEIRRKLGESLASIHKFGAPIEEATTGSFDALKMFAQGDELRRQDKAAESVAFFKRAIELDPQFTLAFGRLGAVYANLNETGLAKQFAEKAFQLRERTSERERLYMAARYYENVSGEAGKAIDNYEVWRNSYPRDWIPVNNLANKYTDLGQYDKAIEAAREAVRLNPNHSFPQTVLARAYRRAGRFMESKTVCESVIATHLDGWGIHSILYQIAFAEGDSAAMQRQVDWGAGKPTEDETLMDEALAAATTGRLHDSRELFHRAFSVASKDGHPDNAGAAVVSQASVETMFEILGAAKERVAAAMAVEGAQVSEDAALVLARSGDLARAESLAEGLIRKDPLNTLVNEFYVPGIRAEVEIKRGRPERAVDLLRGAAPFELRNFTVPYIRGSAYLAAHMGTDAAQEFQKILKNQGVDPISPYYPLAHIGLAQAHALEGDKLASRCEYEAFFALWKGADKDIPILREARSTYAELVQQKPETPTVHQCVANER